MAYIMIVWVLILIATLGLITSLSLIKKYLTKHNIKNKHYLVAKHYLIKYMGLVTILITLLWWVSLILFEINIKEQTISDESLRIMLIAVPVITLIVFGSFFAVQKYMNNYFEIKSNNKSSFTVVSCLTFMTSLVYAMMVNYGLQLIIIFVE